MDDAFRESAARACHRADVVLDEFEFDDAHVRVVVSCERGTHTFANVGRPKCTVEQFEELVYRTVVDWTNA